VRLERDIFLGNANRVPFSRIERGEGWSTAGAFTPTPSLITSDGRSFIAAQPTFTAANQDVYLFNSPRFVVNEGERLSVSGRIQAFALSGGANPSLWQYYIEFYNASSAIISNTPIGSGTTSMSESILHSAFATAPTGTRSAQVVLLYRSSGAGPVRMAILEPMVTSALSGQTAHPPFTPGPNSFDGADVTALNSPSLETLQGQIFQADYLGVLSTGQLPRSIQAVRRRGTTDVSSTTTWSLTTSNCTATISAGGNISITAVSGTGSVTVISVRDSVELRTSFDVVVQRAPPPASGGGGTTANVSSFTSILGNSTWTTITTTLTVTTGSVGQVQLSAPLEFNVGGTYSNGLNSFGAQLRWQRESSPGTWSTLATVSETELCYVEYDTEIGVIYGTNGLVTCNFNSTGLGASTTQKFRLQGFASTGATRDTWFFGTASAVGS